MFIKEVYTRRRAELKKNMKQGIIILLGNTDVPMNYPANTYRWRQDSNFLYYYGLDYQNMAGIIDVDNDTEHLFGNDVSLDGIIWMGPQITTEEKAAACGVSNHQAMDRLPQMVETAIKQGRRVHFLPPYRAENMLLLEKLTGIKTSRLREEASVELIKAVVAQRSIKDEFEIAELEKAMDVAWQMHTTAMKMARPGVYEREVAGAIEGIAIASGGMLSFPAIVTRRGETLHNHYHGNQLKKGDLLLVDAGTETPMHYATDHTRTSPVGGKFSAKQKDIYEIVLQAQLNAIEATSPGVTNKSVHMLAAETLATGLRDLGLMKGNVKDAVAQGAHALFMPHGLGHMMGLDVHDMEDLGENYVGYDDQIKRSDIFGTAFLRLGRELKPGFVLTIEPGCYFIPALIDKWQSEGKFNAYIDYEKVNDYRDFGGIRIEDDILVTETGKRVMGKPIPKTVKEVEDMVASG